MTREPAHAMPDGDTQIRSSAEHRTARGKRRRRSRNLAKVRMQPAQRPSPQVPLVKVAHQQRRMRAVALDAARILRTCSRRSPGRSPRCVAMTRSGSVSRYRCNVERAARLVIVDSQVEMLDALHRDSSTAPRCRNRCRGAGAAARDDVKSGRALEVAEKILVRLRGRDFLQRDDVGADLAQHVDDASGCVAAVGADRAMDVPGGDGQRQRCRRAATGRATVDASTAMGRHRGRGAVASRARSLRRSTQASATISTAAAARAAQTFQRPGRESRRSRDRRRTSWS